MDNTVAPMALAAKILRKQPVPHTAIWRQIPYNDEADRKLEADVMRLAECGEILMGVA